MSRLIILGRRIAACALLALGATAPVQAQPRSFTIDVILSLTGSAAPLGQDEAAALVAYERLANRSGGLRGQPIHFEILDDQSNPATAVALLGPVLAQNPAVVLGATIAGPTQAMAALVKANGPVLYALTPNITPDKGGFVFSAGCVASNYGAAALRFFRARGVTKIATVTTSDASGQNNLASLDEALTYNENKTMRVIDREQFALSDISMAAQGARIKAAAPQAVFAYPNGSEFGTALHGLADAGLNLPVYTSAANFNPTLLDRFKAIVPTELYSTAFSFFNRDRRAGDPLKEPIDEFYAELGAANIQPTVAHMFAWDPARIVVTLLRQLGPNATAQQLRDAILALHRFPGAAGIYDFGRGDQHGLSQDAVLVIRYDPKSPTSRSVVVSQPGGAPLKT